MHPVTHRWASVYAPETPYHTQDVGMRRMRHKPQEANTRGKTLFQPVTKVTQEAASVMQVGFVIFAH